MMTDLELAEIIKATSEDVDRTGCRVRANGARTKPHRAEPPGPSTIMDREDRDYVIEPYAYDDIRLRLHRSDDVDEFVRAVCSELYALRSELNQLKGSIGRTIFLQ